MIATLARYRIHYAWIVAGVTFITMLSVAGIRAMPGVLILPLEQEFGWNRAMISVAVSISLLLSGLCGPFAASWIGRFGIRRVVMCSLPMVAISVGSIALIRTIWQLDVLWGLVVGLATGSMASVLAVTVTNRWFTERRGLVVGTLSTAHATGQVVFLPLLAIVGVHFGWRIVVLVAAGVALLIWPLNAFLMREHPADVGLLPFGAREAAVEQAGSQRPLAALAALGLGVRSGDFWLLAGSFFVCGASTAGVLGAHFIPASVEHGVPEVTAASLLGLIGALNIVGTMSSGWLADRFDNRWLLCCYYLGRGISLLFLPYAYGLGIFGLLGFVIFYGLDWFATVPPTVGLANKVFGRRDAPVYYGWIFAAHQIGSSVAALGAGSIRTWLGDYQVAFMSSGLLCLIAAGIVIRIGRASRGAAAPISRVPIGAAAAS